MIVGVDERNKVILTTTPIIGARSEGYRVITLRQVPRILVDRTIVYRPLISGISIGHEEITAGTLSCPVMRDGEYYILSNAHVFHPRPWETTPSATLRIMQPGPHDININYPNVDVSKFHAVNFVEHVPVNVERASTCPTARIWAGVYNTFAELFGARTRLIPSVEVEPNKVDAAIGKPIVDFEDMILGDDGSLFKPNGIVGLLFAGSDVDKIYIVCKASNIQKLLGVRFLHGIYEPQLDEIVHKCGRTTGHTSGPVVSTSMSTRVWYGVGFAPFDDCIVVSAGCSGGDSGSLVYV
jgi:hypothetical protein